MQGPQSAEPAEVIERARQMLLAMSLTAGMSDGRRVAGRKTSN